MEQRRRTAPHLGTLCLEVWKAKYACATQGHTSARKYIIGYVLFNFAFKAGLLRWRGYAFFNWCRSWILRKREKDTENNLQSATVSLQVVIGLCRRKETAALKIKAAVSNGRVKLSALRRLFFFCRRAADHFNIRLKYRYSVLSSTNTTSGRLLNRNGIILFPRPRLTTIFVFPSV